MNLAARPDNAFHLGVKALDILQVAALLEGETRTAAWQHLNGRYAPKAVRRKLFELHQRGYVESTMNIFLHPETALLTPKGRQALEPLPMSG